MRLVETFSELEPSLELLLPTIASFSLSSLYFIGITSKKLLVLLTLSWVLLPKGPTATGL